MSRAVRSALAGVGGALLVVCGGTVPARADQTLVAADNGTVACTASRKELTRINLIGDQFASVSKVSTGVPYNDFTVVNEPVRGDIYLSVPETYAPKSLSFFATTRKGYVYKFACRIAEIDAAQVFVSNPAIAVGQARAWEDRSSTQQEAVTRLVQAMATQALPDGFQVQQPWSDWMVMRSGDGGQFRVRLMADYTGATLKGQVYRIENRTRVPVALDASFAPEGALVVSFEKERLEPQEATSAYVVFALGR